MVPQRLCVVQRNFVIFVMSREKFFGISARSTKRYRYFQNPVHFVPPPNELTFSENKVCYFGGLLMPILFKRETSVVGFMPKISAAPPGP